MQATRPARSFHFACRVLSTTKRSANDQQTIIKTMIYELRSFTHGRIRRTKPTWQLCHLAAWRWIEITLAILCRRRWHSYADYLRSQVWAWKRERALGRDGRACKLCNCKAGLQVHHREYPARWGDEPDDDLVTLCAGCHRKFHGKATAVNGD